MNPFFSIIIPSYNRAQIITNAIKSVLNQTFSDWELIVVDDASNDNTEIVVSDFLKNEKIKYRKNEKNSGVSVSRNEGAKIAKGQFLLFLDSDDTMPTEALQRFYEIQSKATVIFGNTLMVDSKGKEKYKKPYPLGKAFKNVVGLFLSGSFAIERELFLSVGGFQKNLSFGENYELGLRICNAEGVSFASCNYCTVQYNINTESRISNSSTNKLDSVLFLLEKHYHWVERDKELLSTTLSQAGYLYNSLGAKDLALKYFMKSIRVKPFNLKNWYRIVMIAFK